jgi:hypothetical protein
MAFISNGRGDPIYIDEARGFHTAERYDWLWASKGARQLYTGITGSHIASMSQLDTMYHHATSCISPLTVEECFIFLTDLENNPSEFFTKLHQNTCEIMGVTKNFSKLETITPYLSLAYTFPQTAVAELKNRFKSINHPKEKKKS